MRIISGKYKGRKVNAPKNLPTRPTTDFAKEALFNILNHQFYLNEINVLDLFAGIGSISYEFISRGAEKVDAVESFAKCANFIEETKEKLEMKNLEVYKQDVFQFLSRGNHNMYDIIFADPPFEFDTESYEKIIQMVFEQNYLDAGGMLILEHSVKHDFHAHSNFLDHKKYGNVHFSFFENLSNDEE
ncbi:MAG: 16S rRNA (guanine(966)-N(2))-methyltransferase RsmD [Flavobacteriaceae bacterium]|nr:16S rRNA (guanine(966)-N(2))-methyltransferase RsmD [Flavobacteriaceae bacterium]